MNTAQFSVDNTTTPLGPHYYYTFNQGHAVTSWRIERLVYDLADPKQLLDFILVSEKRYPNFYLTWWKKLGEPSNV